MLSWEETSRGEGGMVLTLGQPRLFEKIVRLPSQQTSRTNEAASKETNVLLAHKIVSLDVYIYGFYNVTIVNY